MHVKSHTTMTNTDIFIWSFQSETENANIYCIRKETSRLEVKLEGIMKMQS